MSFCNCHVDALNAAFQHANVYQADVSDAKRLEFRKFVGSQLRTYLSLIPIPSEVHFGNISLFADIVYKQYSEKNILAGDRFRIGIAQKALNLYLKYLWCIKPNFPEPPHCPFDSIVIGQLDSKDWTTWTTLDDIEKYRSLVKAAQEKAGNMSLARWELKIWQESFDISS